MRHDLHGKVVLVTGATGAIGQAITQQFAASGAKVAVHGSNPTRVDAALDRLQSGFSNGQFFASPADFRSASAIDIMVASIVDHWGRLDAVVHCGIAGAPHVTGPFLASDPTHYADHAAWVLGSFQRLCHATLPHLMVRGGTIIGFASDAGRFAAPRQAIVGGAFGGIMAFIRNLAPEIAREQVRIHCISPSFVADTPVYAANSQRALAAEARAGLGLPTPEDIAPLALFLCGDGARKLTGQIISVNGGMHA